MLLALLIILAILLVPVIYNLLFPLKPPNLDGYFYPGQTFESKWEGVRQTVIKQVGDKVYTEVILAAGAAGPPEHLHLDFDETGVVKQGQLTVKVNGETSLLQTGQRLRFPKGHYHTFSNKSGKELIISGEKEEDYIPVAFAYTLSKFYELFDRQSKFKMLHFFFKMSMFGD